MENSNIIAQRVIKRVTKFWASALFLIVLISLGSHIVIKNRYDTEIQNLKNTIIYNRCVDSTNIFHADSIQKYIDTARIVF